MFLLQNLKCSGCECCVLSGLAIFIGVSYQELEKEWGYIYIAGFKMVVPPTVPYSFSCKLVYNLHEA